MKISRRDAVEAWLGYGIEDFIIAFDVLVKWPWHQPFFIEQGLEKICKAYLIGRRSLEYRKTGHKQARKIIHKIAQSLGHRVGKLVEQVAIHVPSASHAVGQNYDGYPGRTVLMVLEQGYEETRYPVDEPVSSRFPIPGTRGMFWDPLGSSSLEKCAFAISRAIIEAAERHFHARFPVVNPCKGQIDDHTWERFCRLLLQREVLCQQCRSKKE